MNGFDDFNPTAFNVANVADTCAVWNLVSSDQLYGAARMAGLTACLTAYVRYECLVKPRKRQSDEDTELCHRLSAALERKEISVHSLALEDLQEVELLSRRKRLGLGELSCLAFAKRTGICVLSDDRKATIFGREVLGAASRVQTTPHVFGWLLFLGHLVDRDIETVVTQHRAVRRPLEPHLRAMAAWIELCRSRGGDGGEQDKSAPHS